MAASDQAVPVASSGSPGTTFPWVQVAWFALLVGVLFAPVIGPMVDEWATQEEMGHGFFVPVVAGYIIWLRRDELMKLEMQGHWLGYPIMVAGFFGLIGGFLGADFFIQRMAFMSTLFGLLLALMGWPLIRAFGFPLFLLLFMIRIPLFIYSQITFPLQLFASTVAAEVINAVGIPVYQDGNVLETPTQKLQVVEACSGIRSLISLSFLSLVFGYFFDKKSWMKWVLLVASVPIAIGANAIRVSMTGILGTYNPKLAEGLYHTMEGWVLFMVALVALIATHSLFNLGHKMLTRRQAPAPEETANA